MKLGVMSSSEKRPPRPQSVLRHVKSALEEIVDTEDLEVDEEGEGEEAAQASEEPAPSEKTTSDDSA